MTDRGKLLALADIDPELVERMANAIRRHVAGYVNLREGYSITAEFRAIADELPEPIDPDLIEARRTVAGQYGDSGNVAHLVAQALSGGGDEWFHTRCALAAIKRDRELAQAEALS